MLNQSISGLGGELDLSEADLKVGILVITKAGIVLHTEKLVLLK